MKPKQKIVFFGTPYFAKEILRKLIASHEVLLVVTQKDKPRGRSQKPISSPVKELAFVHGIPVVTPEKMDEIVPKLTSLEADFYIVAAYGKLLPAEILNLPKTDTLNVHPSLLPKYRGPAPVHTAIIRGDAVTGSSIMVVTEKMDAGPVLSQSKTEISPEDTTETLTEKLADSGADLLLAALEDYETLKKQPQDETKATYTAIITKKDGLIDWKEDASKIERKVRAFVPWPLAHTFWNDLKLNILNANVNNSKVLRPGEVSLSEGKLFIGCGNGSLEIEKLQPAGKNILSAKDFVNGYSQINGQILN